jgi:hypothetical protein
MKQEVLEQRLKDLIRGKEDERNWMGSRDGSRETTILILKSILEDLQSLEKTDVNNNQPMNKLGVYGDALDECIDELISYRKLKSAVHKDIEKVWMYDTSMQYGVEKYRTLAEADSKERSKIIERVFYKIANKWID